MIAQPTPEVNSHRPPAWQLAKPTPESLPRRSYVQWSRVFDRPIPNRWRWSKADAFGAIQFDGPTRYTFLEAAHWLVDAPITVLRRATLAPESTDHVGHRMAAAVLTIARIWPPMDTSPATWLMQVREWRDEHLDQVNAEPPPWPWINDRSAMGAIHCMAAHYAVSVVWHCQVAKEVR